MIDIIITSYNEPNATLRAVNSFLHQKIKGDFRITVVDPFPKVGEFLKKKIKSKNFTFFLDPGEGKSYALNLLFQEYASKDNNDIFILTDGDVYVSENSVKEIEKAFDSPEIGCVTGKPVPLDSRKDKYGRQFRRTSGGSSRQSRWFTSSWFMGPPRQKSDLTFFQITPC